MNNSRTDLAQVSSSNALNRGMSRHDIAKIWDFQKQACRPKALAKWPSAEGFVP